MLADWAPHIIAAGIIVIGIGVVAYPDPNSDAIPRYRNIARGFLATGAALVVLGIVLVYT